jgi:PTH1 family peptidyl-tRNA hydrolase
MLRYLRDRINKMSETKPVFLIAGFGNPGRQYRENRHNVGFMLLDRLAGKLDVNFTRMESNALVCKTSLDDERLVLAKPQTYMNQSGQPVASLLRYYRVELDRLLVVYDDVDLDLGVLRIRPEGGSAGQKGITSVIDRLGTKQFARMRIGIGRPPGRMDAAAYVLQDFPESDRSLLDEVLDSGVEAVLTFVTDGIDEAMNKFNGPVT